MNGESAATSRSRIILPASLIAAAVVARLVSLQGLHPLNWDEIEFYRCTDWVRRGLVPYRDFWEHHTPLQWFLFAPFAALTHSSGARAIIAMRWAQLPLWIACFALLNLWMRGAGISRWARWSAMALPLTSSLFMLPAVEFRVDVVATVLLIAALVCVQRMARSPWYAVAAGAAFCLSGFANLRSGPVVVLAMLLARITDFDRARWGTNRRANLIFAGAAATFALCAVYFVATGSALIAFHRLWTDNYLADRLAPVISHPFIHRILTSFGYRTIGVPPFTMSGIDPAGILLEIAIVLVIRELIRRRSTPDHLFYFAFVQGTNILFIAAMKYIFNYHFESVALLMVPFIATEIDRLDLRRSVAAALLLTTGINVAVAIFRGKERDTAYQNLIMTEAERMTPPGSRVWDSVGWALHREPAYRYWLLRLIAKVLVDHGYYEPYTPREMAAHPPAAVVADHDVRFWIATHLDLGRFVVAHYLPFWRELWLPGMSARLSPQRPMATWIVPADGTYRVYAAPRLANHPWFYQPLNWETANWHERALVEVTPNDALAVTGVPLEWSQPPGGDALTLTKGQRLVVLSRAVMPVGIFITPYAPNALFRQPPPRVTLEGSADPEWHVPDFSLLP